MSQFQAQPNQLQQLGMPQQPSMQQRLQTSIFHQLKNTKTVKNLKDQYFAELNDLHNKISLKLQHVDNMPPPQKPTDQYEKMKN
ncbi:hypothetical protein E2562_035482 [Oryza meyeriana var. granulata]|uniref:Uncharacterized protein n=1 Tax=Oryza meyeriana var. granulata TaxID=110450 RepID=A0A6G1CLB8_9ORYZ|nr:hypothetical protein E2562_035482 [Oryza meyeriana var. granulata]